MMFLSSSITAEEAPSEKNTVVLRLKVECTRTDGSLEGSAGTDAAAALCP